VLTTAGFLAHLLVAAVPRAVAAEGEDVDLLRPTDKAFGKPTVERSKWTPRLLSRTGILRERRALGRGRLPPGIGEGLPQFA
jgi:hypothetical protein